MIVTATRSLYHVVKFIGRYVMVDFYGSSIRSKWVIIHGILNLFLYWTHDSVVGGQ